MRYEGCLTDVRKYIKSSSGSQTSFGKGSRPIPCFASAPVAIMEFEVRTCYNKFGLGDETCSMRTLGSEFHRQKVNDFNSAVK